jgi:hypothetical protein
MVSSSDCGDSRGLEIKTRSLGLLAALLALPATPSAEIGNEKGANKAEQDRVDVD